MFIDVLLKVATIRIKAWEDARLLQLVNALAYLAMCIGVTDGYGVYFNMVDI